MVSHFFSLMRFYVALQVLSSLLATPPNVMLLPYKRLPTLLRSTRPVAQRPALSNCDSLSLQHFPHSSMDCPKAGASSSFRSSSYVLVRTAKSVQTASSLPTGKPRCQRTVPPFELAFLKNRSQCPNVESSTSTMVGQRKAQSIQLQLAASLGGWDGSPEPNRSLANQEIRRAMALLNSFKLAQAPPAKQGCRR